MTTGTVSTKSRYVTMVSPVAVALVGTIVVMLLLLFPIYTLGPGDDEEQRCGTALSIDLDRWRGYPAEDYFEKAQRICSGKRIDRIAEAVGVESVTVLLTVTLMVWRRRPNPL
jgi:hypothetical protein